MCPSLFFWRCSWGGDALFIRKTIPIIATLPNVVAKWKFCAIEKQYSSLIFSSKHHEISVWNFGFSQMWELLKRIMFLHVLIIICFHHIEQNTEHLDLKINLIQFPSHVNLEWLRCRTSTVDMISCNTLSKYFYISTHVSNFIFPS